MTAEPPIDQPTAAAQVPNFREDERAEARYAAMLARRIKTHFVEHESSIRRNASTKRAELREELREVQEESDRASAAAETAREAYRAAHPAHVKRTRLIAPSMSENIRSFGAANRLYRAADEAWRAAEHAASNLRRVEHNEAQLEIELKKALERAPQVSKDVTESEAWLAEIHAEEELGALKAQVDAIAAERADYAARLAANAVSDEERRLRTFAQNDVKRVKLPLNGVMFLRIDRFGPASYYVLRDLRKQLYALPYDRRLEPLIGDVYDIVPAGKEFIVRPAMRENSRTALSLHDHFLTCSENDAVAANEAYREHQRFAHERRLLAAMTERDENEATVIELLAGIAAQKA